MKRNEGLFFCIEVIFLSFAVTSPIFYSLLHLNRHIARNLWSFLNASACPCIAPNEFNELNASTALYNEIMVISNITVGTKESPEVHVRNFQGDIREDYIHVAY
jgi:hypothetical protein